MQGRQISPQPNRTIGIQIAWSIQRYFTNYFQFSGRADQAEFAWAYALFGILPTLLYFLTKAPGSPSLLHEVSMVCVLGLVIPNFSLMARRLHDTGKSAWFLLLGFAGPGALLLFVLCCKQSEKNTNKFGSVVVH